MIDYNTKHGLNIAHTFDCWHMMMSLMNGLRKLAKTVAGRKLLQWLKSINNQLWACFANAKGKYTKLVKGLMLLSS